jgi:antitoxin (DNA-binding transcriptional repressor) of toxin-antitoxin stability system
LSDMKKINARVFQKEFGKVADGLKPGETVEITRHGKSVGQFTRTPRHVKMPDFLALLEKHSCTPALGDRLLKKFNEALS